MPSGFSPCSADRLYTLLMDAAVLAAKNDCESMTLSNVLTSTEGQVYFDLYQTLGDHAIYNPSVEITCWKTVMDRLKVNGFTLIPHELKTGQAELTIWWI